MLVLGIDPGTATTGYGLVRELADGDLQAVDYGVITTPAHTPMPDRLRQIYHEITALIAQHQPAAAAVETMYFGKNVTTAITVAQARGVSVNTPPSPRVRNSGYDQSTVARGRKRPTNLSPELVVVRSWA